MATALSKADSSIEDVISTRVLVASTKQADLVTAWEVVRAAFGKHDAPSTLLGVTVLGYDHQLVEVKVIAAVRDRRDTFSPDDLLSPLARGQAAASRNAIGQWNVRQRGVA